MLFIWCQNRGIPLYITKRIGYLWVIIMKVLELREKLDTLPDGMEVVVFRSGDVIKPNIDDVVVIDDTILYDEPTLEIGTGW